MALSRHTFSIVKVRRMPKPCPPRSSKSGKKRPQNTLCLFRKFEE
jgi:hypothetical protein